MANNTSLELLDDNDFKKKVFESKHPVVVAFGTEWSGACYITDFIIGELLSEFKRKIKFYKVDVDSSEAIAREYGIRDIPTLLFFKSGMIVDHIMGTASKKVMDDKLNALLKNSHT